jgi:hypothetical protein
VTDWCLALVGNIFKEYLVSMLTCAIMVGSRLKDVDPLVVANYYTFISSLSISGKTSDFYFQSSLIGLYGSGRNAFINALISMHSMKKLNENRNSKYCMDRPK